MSAVASKTFAVHGFIPMCAVAISVRAVAVGLDKVVRCWLRCQRKMHLTSQQNAETPVHGCGAMCTAGILMLMLMLMLMM